MVKTEVGIATVPREEHLLKEEPPIMVTEVGMKTDLREKHD